MIFMSKIRSLKLWLRVLTLEAQGKWLNHSKVSRTREPLFRLMSIVIDAVLLIVNWPFGTESPKNWPLK